MVRKKKEDVEVVEKNKSVYNFETDETDFFQNDSNIDDDDSSLKDEDEEYDEESYGLGKIIRALFIITIVIIVGVALWAFNSPLFIIEEVEIANPTSESYEEINNLTKDLVGKNIFLEDLTAMKNQISQLSHVKNVNIKRVLPNKLKILYSDREPYVMVKKETEYYILDSDGYILEINLVDNVYDIPTVSGLMNNEDYTSSRISDTDVVKLKNIQYLLESIEHVDFGYEISNIQYSTTSGISFLIKDTEFNVKFGHIKKDQINDKLLYLKAIVAESLAQGFKGTLDISSDNYNEKSVLINNY